MAKIEDIIAAERHRLENVLRAAYEAGKADAKNEILMVLSGGATTTSLIGGASEETDERKRAPKGLPRKLVRRVMFENHIIGGVTPQDIADAAVSEHEKMIRLSTIRGELRKGRDEGIYFDKDGHWSLTDEEYEDMLMDKELSMNEEA